MGNTPVKEQQKSSDEEPTHEIIDGKTLMSMMSKGENLLPIQPKIDDWVYIERRKT